MKHPRDMSAAEINREIDSNSKKHSASTDAFIKAGRGSETSDETWKKRDPLALKWQALCNRRADLHNEIELRTGQRYSKCPKGFGPRK